VIAPLDASAALFVPARPARLLVLAPGHPWVDGERTDAQLLDYAREAVGRWRSFAVTHGAVLVAPVFGTRYPDFRAGGAAGYVSSLVDDLLAQHLPGTDGRFAVHGHSAGAQFAARYLAARPERLTDAVLSAPAEYAMPAPDVPWPRGMAGAPPGADWLAAATRVRVVVLAGTNDTEPQQPAAGHVDAGRFARAEAYVAAMQRLAAERGTAPSVAFRPVAGLDHDEAALAVPAQEALTDAWAPRAGSRGRRRP
jgi:alpha-beta hydrolase superfamily lysophospholipase